MHASLIEGKSNMQSITPKAIRKAPRQKQCAHYPEVATVTTPLPGRDPADDGSSGSPGHDPAHDDDGARCASVRRVADEEGDLDP